MKAKIIKQQGAGGEIEVPKYFSEKIREDIVQKFYEVMKRQKQQPYAPNFMAGKTHSASGISSKSRRLWKNTYGKGISRVPRKIMWRRGDHFYWIGAEIASSVGGRPAHPPRVEHFQKKLKMNKKEAIMALKMAMASTSMIDYIKRRYSSLSGLKLDLPLVISSEILALKTKQFFEFLRNSLGEAYDVALKNKRVRAGKGKARGRRYKENAGLLLIIGKNEKASIPGIEIRRLDEIEAQDLWPLGRLTIYSENAMKELNDIREGK
jgi:large subunit ribosomal protein L4e